MPELSEKRRIGPDLAISPVGESMSQPLSREPGTPTPYWARRQHYEAAWWKNAGVDPTVTARALWLETHPPPTIQDIEGVDRPSSHANVRDRFRGHARAQINLKLTCQMDQLSGGDELLMTANEIMSNLKHRGTEYALMVSQTPYPSPLDQGQLIRSRRLNDIATHVTEQTPAQVVLSWLVRGVIAVPKIKSRTKTELVWTCD